jgi:AraC family transcriptional regulator
MDGISCEYVKRINRVIDYVRNNLDQSLKLDDLANIACFSTLHFHRIFGALTGETVSQFTNRSRLEKAARLLRDTKLPITIIGLECGFSSSATFSRSFKNQYDKPPKLYRNSGDFKNSKICKELFPGDEYVLPMADEIKEKLFQVEVKNFPVWDIGYIRVLNSYEGDRVIQAFGKIIKWARDQNILDDGVLFGMSIDDPLVTPKKLYQYEVCIASKMPFECIEGMSRMKLPARQYAVVRINGDIRMVATAWNYLYRGWLIKSDYEPEHAPAIEVFLNKEKALDWSNFELDLCLPVNKIHKH